MNDSASEPDDRPFTSTPGVPWPSVALREERHFGDRLLRCFAERPRHLPQMLQEAHARDPQAPALATGRGAGTGPLCAPTAAGLPTRWRAGAWWQAIG
jgi:hypothetical protein